MLLRATSFLYFPVLNARRDYASLDSCSNLGEHVLGKTRRLAACQEKPSSFCPVLVLRYADFLSSGQNIPPRWIGNAQKSRKHIEPEIVKALRSVKRIQQNRPRAQVALRNANKHFKAVLMRWETAYNKENFYRGIRILLELQRNGSSVL